MALTVGVNAYVDLMGALTYFTDRLDSDAWATASDTDKQAALVTASKMLNDIYWMGTAASDSQQLAFPREGSYFEPLLGKPIALDPTKVPQRIIDATCEQAIHLLANENLMAEEASPTRIKVDVIELDGLGMAKPQRMSRVAQRLYGPLVNSQSNDLSWWRRN